MSKLDIIATGSKVADLRSVLKESYSRGRDLLTAGNGRLLARQRISLYKQLKKLGDYAKLSVARLRYYAKRLGIQKCVRMRKQTIILALKKFETTHNAEIFSGAISLNKVEKTRADYVGRMAKKVRKNRRLNVWTKPVDVEPNIRDDHRPQRFRRPRYKGLENIGNTCYFNSVIQCLLHCPLAKQAIENVPLLTVSNTALRLRILFTRMTNNDTSTYLSPSQCFKAVMDTPECKAVQMGLNKRQEDVHEFLLKLLEHFNAELSVTAHTFDLFCILKIHLLSTTTCHQCSRSSDV